jgi:hypothetical protein
LVKLLSEVRVDSKMGGCGDLDGPAEICEGDLEEGKEDREVRRGPAEREPLDWPLVLCDFPPPPESAIFPNAKARSFA